MLRLRRTLEDWLGVAPAAAGEDTQWAFRLPMAWPDWALALVGLVALAFVVGIYLREGATPRPAKLFLAGCRLLAIALVVLMLGEWELAIDRTGLPDLVIAVDDSESQSVRDRADTATTEPEATRWERVAGWLATNDGARLKDQLGRHKLRVYAQSSTHRELSSVVTPADVGALLATLKETKPEGHESRIGANVRGILNDLRTRPPAALVLATDGVVTGAGESLLQVAQYAARKQVPVFAVGVGDPQQPRDVEIADLQVDDTVFVGADVTFQASVSSKGLAGRTVTVSLKGEGIEPPLTQSVTLGPDGSKTPVQITYRPRKDAPQRVGTFRYTLDIPPAERETILDNNKVEKMITFTDEKIRVLMVDYGPRYEFRYLKNLLERQSTMDVKAVLFQADAEFVQQDRTALGYVPTSLDELRQYDVLVLGDVPPTLLTPAQLNNMVEFVRKGGGLAIVAGSFYAPATWRDTPLEPLLPVKLSGAGADLQATVTRSFAPQLTVQGQLTPNLRFDPDEAKNREIWRALPRGYWYAHVEEKPPARVLLEHPSARKDGKPVPIAATQKFGAGRVYYQGFDGTWRWRFRAEDRFHAQYWIQTVQFLCDAKRLGKNRAVELSVDRKQLRRGEPVRVRVRYRDEGKAPRDGDGVTVEVAREGPLDAPAKIALQRVPNQRDQFEGVFAQTEDGRYRVRLPSPDGEQPEQVADFTVMPPPGELDDVRMREEDLRELAKRSGGRYFSLAEADGLWDALPPGRQVAINTIPPIPLWRTWPMLGLFVGLLVVEWVARKRWRLI